MAKKKDRTSPEALVAAEQKRRNQPRPWNALGRRAVLRAKEAAGAAFVAHSKALEGAAGIALGVVDPAVAESAKAVEAALETLKAAEAADAAAAAQAHAQRQRVVVAAAAKMERLQEEARAFAGRFPTPEEYRKFFLDKVVPEWNTVADELETIYRMCTECGARYAFIDSRTLTCGDTCRSNKNKRPAAQRKAARIKQAGTRARKGLAHGDSAIAVAESQRAADAFGHSNVNVEWIARAIKNSVDDAQLRALVALLQGPGKNSPERLRNKR